MWYNGHVRNAIQERCVLPAAGQSAVWNRFIRGSPKKFLMWQKSGQEVRNGRKTRNRVRYHKSMVRSESGQAVKGHGKRLKSSMLEQHYQANI